MRKTLLKRIPALLLSLVMVAGCFVISVSAEGGETTGTNSSVSTKTIADFVDKLSAISYKEYLQLHASVSRAAADITVNAVDALVADADSSTAAYEIVTIDGEQAVYTPSSGKITIKVNVPERARYTLIIRYNSVAAKAAAIEREIKINGKTPFSEVSEVTFPKNYELDYAKAKLYVAESETAAYLQKAGELGIEAQKGSDEKGTYIEYSYPEFWTGEISSYLNEELKLRFMTTDISNNELRPSAVQVPVWSDYAIRDIDGIYADPFEFVFEKGENTITLTGINEPMAISSITLAKPTDRLTYQEYISKYASAQPGTDLVKIEGEYVSSLSSNTVYPIENRSDAAMSPSDVTRTVLNQIGGEKWETPGKAISYSFSVSSAGLYDIVARFKQDLLDGMFVCRNLYIYSEGLAPGEDGYYDGIPFEEATAIRFGYTEQWKTTVMNGGLKDENGNDINYQFYFKAGVKYTIKFEVTLGSMGELLQEATDILNHINDDYLNILKLTGTTPDQYRDYGFYRVMPQTCKDLIVQSRRLNEMNTYFKEVAGQASTVTAVLDQISMLLNKMGTDEDNIAVNLSNLKAYIGTLGTFLTEVKNQPLDFDYIQIQGAGQPLPKASANFFVAFWHEMKSFFASFFRDYNSLGAMAESDKEGSASIEAWLALGRDQAQVVRNMCTNRFTANTGIAVDLKLVAGGTLLPSILSGSGPDVYLGLSATDVINYAIRGALIPIENQEGFAQVTTSFTDAAMLVLGIEDKYNVMHYYGLPETQTFEMMFVRVDVLAKLGIDIPKTWDDIYAALPILEANNMEVGVPLDYGSELYQVQYCTFLYQNDGDLFADGGMRINLDSSKGLEAFNQLTELYTMHSFPYSFEASNRFRTGEMPIVLNDYVGLYNKLKVFATEIDGLWTFLPIPGTKDENGNINNRVISTVGADVLITGCDDIESSWKFISWYTSAETQAEYATEMVAIIGDSAKQATANKDALALMPWTPAEYEQIMLQFNNLAAIPNYPGYYILYRYTEFAFLAAYGKDANPVTELLSYINTINKEISRKRKEFELETLEVGQTLAAKRTSQAVEAYLALAQKAPGKYDKYIEEAKYALANKNVTLLQQTSESIMKLLSSVPEDDYFVYVSQQSAEARFGGYSISSLTEYQLLYFISKCLSDTYNAYLQYAQANS